MRTYRPALLALATLLVAWAAAEVKAGPYAEYNRQRALRLFYSSPSPHRVYSGFTPGYAREYATPYGYTREWRTPSYRHERITPFGYERYDAPFQRGTEHVEPPRVLATPPYPVPLPPPY